MQMNRSMMSPFIPSLLHVSNTVDNDASKVMQSPVKDID